MSQDFATFISCNKQFNLSAYLSQYKSDFNRFQLQIKDLNEQLKHRPAVIRNICPIVYRSTTVALENASYFDWSHNLKQRLCDALRDVSKQLRRRNAKYLTTIAHAIHMHE